MIRDKNKMVAYLVSAGIGLAAAVSGAFLVAPSEGYNNNTYLDPVDIITSCYGHTGNDLKQGQTFTDEQCLDQLSKDLGEANDAEIGRAHVRTPVTNAHNVCRLLLEKNKHDPPQHACGTPLNTVNNSTKLN